VAVQNKIHVAHDLGGVFALLPRLFVATVIRQFQNDHVFNVFRKNKMITTGESVKG
jgi:hypothetical protein